MKEGKKDVLGFYSSHSSYVFIIQSQWHLFNRIIDCLTSLKPTQPPFPVVGRAATHQLRLPRAPSQLAMSTSTDGASAASLGTMICFSGLLLQTEFVENCLKNF